MPIYEYHCTTCNEVIEVIQKISDSPLTQCPKCGKNALEKIISPTQFQLKGTGWYVTDFKNKDSAAKKETAKTEATSSDTKKESTTSEKKDEKPKSSDSKS